MFTDKQSDVIYIVPLAATATFITALVFWWLAFNGHAASLWRAAWIGALIPMVSMFVLMVIMTIPAMGMEYYILMIGFMTYFGLMMFAPILVPIGIISAVILRWTQLKWTKQ